MLTVRLWSPMLTSVDLPSQLWALFRFMGFMANRPRPTEWLVAGRFTVVDLLMADVPRQLDRFDGRANLLYLPRLRRAREASTLNCEGLQRPGGPP